MTHRSVLCVAAVALMVGSAAAATTTIDDFESYADTLAMQAVWNTTNGFPVYSLVTSGGADSSTNYLEVIDAGFSLSVSGASSVSVPSDGFYQVTGYYQNGQNGGTTQYGLEFNVVWGSNLEGVDINTANSDTVVSTWTAFSTNPIALTTTDVITLEVKGTAGARANQSCAFDQIMLVGPITPALDVTLDPSSAIWLTGTPTITAIPFGGTGTYTQVEFDVDANGSVDYTDSTAVDGFTFDWDTSLLGENTPEAVTLEATLTDDGAATASTGDVVYTVDNRFGGREVLFDNDFESWTAGVPDGWSEFQVAASGGNMTISQIDSGTAPENVHAGSSSLGVNFAASDFTNRYALISDNLYPGTGIASFLDIIVVYWGKGSSNRCFVWTDTDGDTVYDFNTFYAAQANSPVLVEAISPPFSLNSDAFALATHQFAAGDHYYDSVYITGNQYDVTSVDSGVWNLYH